MKNIEPLRMIDAKSLCAKNLVDHQADKDRQSEWHSHTWLPLEDEHDLAESLGLVDCSSEMLRMELEAWQSKLAAEQQPTRLHVHRWHVWEVVEAMHRFGMRNTHTGRAATYAMLANAASPRVVEKLGEGFTATDETPSPA